MLAEIEPDVNQAQSLSEVHSGLTQSDLKTTAPSRTRSDEQKRRAEHVEDSYEKRGVSGKEATRAKKSEGRRGF